MKSAKRKKVVHNFSSATTAGVLFTANGENFELINEFLSFLSQQNIKVFALIYIPRKEIPDEVVANRKINFFTKNELDFYFRPKPQMIESFIYKEFDLLIDLSTENYFPIAYVNNLSRAHFKVGRSDAENKDYDFMIALSEDKGLRYFIEQIKHYLSEINKEKQSVV